MQASSKHNSKRQASTQEKRKQTIKPAIIPKFAKGTPLP
jgi:hypothetical protein